MSEQEQEIERLESRFPSLSGDAFAAARMSVRALGESILQVENGVIYRVFPDDRKEVVKKIEPPTIVVVGSRFTL